MQGGVQTFHETERNAQCHKALYGTNVCISTFQWARENSAGPPASIPLTKANYPPVSILPLLSISPQIPPHPLSIRDTPTPTPYNIRPLPDHTSLCAKFQTRRSTAVDAFYRRLIHRRSTAIPIRRLVNRRSTAVDDWLKWGTLRARVGRRRPALLQFRLLRAALREKKGGDESMRGESGGVEVRRKW